MKYEIELSRSAFKNLAHIPKRDLLRIQSRMDSLALDPRPIDIKKIQGDENLYRVRSGNYRILYRIFDHVVKILVVDIDHRKDIYR